MTGFLAWIVPVAGGGVPPDGGPGQPPGIWGGGNVPMPNPPIHLGPGGGIGGPPGIWGGGNVPMPSPPIYIPVLPPSDGAHPEHPIYIPVHIWGGGNVPMPSPPIHIPIEMTAEQWKKLTDFLTGNLPQNPNPQPEPVEAQPESGKRR